MLTTLQQEFPSTTFARQAVLVADSEKPRISTGLELQVLMPVVNAPFRLYWAYNLSYLSTTLQAPVVATPGDFTSAQAYASAIQALGQQIPYNERHSLFRFSVGRTF